MKPRLTLLLIVLVTALLGLGAPSCCPTGMWYDGDECVCKPGHEPDADGKGCHRPDLPPDTTTTTTTTTTTLATPPPTAPPTVPPTAPPPTACYQGPWKLSCKWPSCDIVTDNLPDPRYEAAVQSAVENALKTFPGVVDGRMIHETYESDWGAAVRDQLIEAGFCAASYGSPNISGDEVGVWDQTGIKEHWDICTASGAPAGMCYVGPRNIFLTAVGVPWVR